MRSGAKYKSDSVPCRGLLNSEEILNGEMVAGAFIHLARNNQNGSTAAITEQQLGTPFHLRWTLEGLKRR
jgi:hypothetical protein